MNNLSMRGKHKSNSKPDKILFTHPKHQMCRGNKGHANPWCYVRLAPDGNDFDEFIMHRMEEATMMRDRLKTAPLNREHGVAIGFHAIWQMKLKYCFGATCFSKKQCDKLRQARYLPTFLSKMGINRTTATTAVQHGPTSLGGMNVMIHFETEQAVGNTPN
jgi:hypothetical protein